MISPVSISPPLEMAYLPDAHPNELDLRRIMRMLQKRTRYRYVTVNITPTKNGYLIQSPCCSRSISSDGHLINIGLIQYDEASMTWKLFSMDHAEQKWCLHHCSVTLKPLLEYLNADPSKAFWQ
jgi:hypothetical protein